MYGSLVTVWTGSRATVIIGDPQVAHDLLDKRAKIYSSRPRFVVMGTYPKVLPKIWASCIHMQAANR